MNYIIIIVILILLIGFTLLYLGSMLSYFRYGIPQVSSFKSDIVVLRKNLKRYNLKGKKLIDLGSGTGKMLRFFEKEFGAKVYGREIDLANHLIAKIFNKLFSCNANISRGNYLKIDLKDYDFIYIYLFPKMVDIVEKKIWSETKPGTIIFSNAFKFNNHKPKEIFIDDKGREEIYVYEV